MITWRQNKNVAVGEGMFGTIHSENGSLPSFYIKVKGGVISLEMFGENEHQSAKLWDWRTIGQFDSIESAKTAAELLC